MNNLSASLKKFLGNKNTVTILGVLICLVILYLGYNMRINQKVKLVEIPVAAVTIQPRTYITSDMITVKKVPVSFLEGAYFTRTTDVQGKYSNYNTIIAAGSLFYTELLTSEENLPDSAFTDVPEGYTVVNYPVTMSSTYANSMYPGNHINIYYKGLNDDGEIMFGKFISNIEILDVKDSSGQHVFETTAESRVPAYMLFAIPEDTHLLLRKALYLTEYDVELILVPNTATLTEEDSVIVSSSDIEDFIEGKTQMVNVNELPNIEDMNTNINNNQNNETNIDNQPNNQ